MRLLVLATQPVGPEDLRRALPGDGGVEGAEVLVVSPAVNESPLAFWMSDGDEAIADAESTAQRTADSLRQAGADVRAEAGEGEPLTALQDALAQFPADRVVVVARGDEEAQRYREDEAFQAGREALGVPVTEVRL